MKKFILFLALIFPALSLAGDLSQTYFSRMLQTYPFIHREQIVIDKFWRNILPVLPEKAYWMNNQTDPNLQRWVDELTLKIFSTPTGRKLCQIHSGGNMVILNTHLGLSRAKAEQIAPSCTPTHEEMSQIVYRLFSHGKLADSVFLHPNRLAPDSTYLADTERIARFDFSPYSIALFKKDPPPLLGWTKTHQTILMLSPSDVSDENLYRLLIHELYLRTDQKTRFSIVPDVFLRYLLGQEPSCALMQTTMDPTIQMTLAALRAFQIENQILKELGYNVASWSQVACDHKLKIFVPSLNFKMPALEEHSGRVLRELSCPTTALANEKMIEILKSTKIPGTDGDSLCDYLTESEVWPWFIEAASSYAEGPRPRISDGSGARLLQHTPEELLNRPATIRSSDGDLKISLELTPSPKTPSRELLNLMGTKNRDSGQLNLKQ